MNIDVHALKEEQIKLSKKIDIKNELPEIDQIAGVDISYYLDYIIVVIAVFDYKTLKLVEQKTVTAKPDIPYIHGYSSFREAKYVLETFNEIENKPDVIIFDGEGILHQRKFGVASHIGLILDTPSIGVSKKLSSGIVDHDRIFINDELRGYVVNTREKANPIYVSPGHKIGFKKMVEIVNYTLKGNKLPLPLHIAHKFAISAKNKMKVNTESSVEKETDQS